MNNLIIIAITTGVVYFFIKFIQMRFVNRETDSIKGIFKDSIFVMVSTALAVFIISQIGNSITSGNILSDSVGATEGGSVPAFTGNPEF